jgi:hypothetical protein
MTSFITPTRLSFLEKKIISVPISPKVPMLPKMPFIAENKYFFNRFSGFPVKYFTVQSMIHYSETNVYCQRVFYQKLLNCFILWNHRRKLEENNFGSKHAKFKIRWYFESKYQRFLIQNKYEKICMGQTFKKYLLPTFLHIF